jgi:hypothetical protein
MELVPPSVIQGAPSGPMMTPCGAAVGPSDQVDAAGGRVEAAELTGALGGVPHDAVGAHRDVVRAAARGERIGLYRDLRGGDGWEPEQRDEQRG